MNDILTNYINACLHPWLTHDLLNISRKQVEGKRKSPQLELVGETGSIIESDSSEQEKVGVSFHESMSISWVFTIFQATYALIGITMGLNSVEWAGEDLSAVMDNAAVGLTAYSIFSLLLKVVFFPLFFWIYGRFWINILKVFINIFEKIESEEEIESRCEEIVANSLTAHTFLVIPIIGEFLQKFSFLIYLYAGLRRNLGLNLFQSILVLLCPLLIILLFIFVMIMSFGMLLATL